MTLFNETAHVGYGGSLTEKRDGLTMDFLKAGKTIDFVLANVCGSDNKAIAHAIALAQQHNFISPAERVQLLARFKIDETGRKTK